jgi:hypothetical protein
LDCLSLPMRMLGLGEGFAQSVNTKMCMASYVLKGTCTWDFIVLFHIFLASFKNRQGWDPEFIKKI